MAYQRRRRCRNLTWTTGCLLNFAIPRGSWQSFPDHVPAPLHLTTTFTITILWRLLLYSYNGRSNTILVVLHRTWSAVTCIQGVRKNIKIKIKNINSHTFKRKQITSTQWRHFRGIAGYATVMVKWSLQKCGPQLIWMQCTC